MNKWFKCKLMHYILRLCSRKLLLNDTPQKHRPIKSEYIGVLLPGVPWAYYFIYSIIYFIKAFIQKIDRNIMNHTIDSKFILSEGYNIQQKTLQQMIIQN